MSYLREHLLNRGNDLATDFLLKNSYQASSLSAISGILSLLNKGFLLKDNLTQRVAELFKTTKPFIDYINRAVDFVKEEMEG